VDVTDKTSLFSPGEHLVVVRREVVSNANEVVVGELGELGVEQGRVHLKLWDGKLMSCKAL
jgi:hypothetical protein